MATYYVSSVDGSNSDDGSSWANAVATLEYAVETLAASGGPHTILVDSAHSEELSAATTITAAQELRIIGVNRSGSDAPLAGAIIGAQATNYDLAMNGAFRVYIYGLSFRVGTGASTKLLNIAGSDGAHFELEGCSLGNWGSGSGTEIRLGLQGTTTNNFVKLVNCSLKFNGANNYASIGSNVELVGCSIDETGTIVTSLFLGGGGGGKLFAEGCDFSRVTNTLVNVNQANGHQSFTFANCKIAASTILGASAVSANRGGVQVQLLNCNSGDNHYAFAHYDAFGSTVAQTTIYANDGAKYDGTNGVAWAITTTANCSFYTPYVSPWFSQYAEAGTVTPTVEIVRDGSATAYQDDEVWGEWSYQGTSGSTKATIVSDRMALLGTPANQTTGDLGASDWTGENATAWFGKLSPGSITINEIGHLSARIVVGEPEITVYADPTIRV